MKLMIWLLSAVLILSGCQVHQTNTLDILVPTGAPTIAFLSLVDDYHVETCTGSDVLVAEMSKQESDYEVIVAPINLGTKLISQKQTAFELQGVLTWGNLYIVGKEDVLIGEGDLGLFGSAAIPEKIYRDSQIETSLNPIYYHEATQVASDLLAGKINAGMLAEPLASATMKKAQATNGDVLKILYDFQESGGYPQAAVFVKKGIDATRLYKALLSLSKADVETALTKVDLEKMGLPTSDIVLESYERQNIRFKQIQDCQKEVEQFLIQ